MFSHTCPIFLHNYIIPMAKITYITHDNQNHTIDVHNGLSVMEGAVQNDIPGIDADQTFLLIVLSFHQAQSS